MEAISYTTFRQNMASVLDQVSADAAPVQITRQGKQATVVVSLDDWQSLQETLYVLQNENLMRQINIAEQARQNHQVGYKPTQDELNALLNL